MRSNGRVSPGSKLPPLDSLDLRVDAALPTPRYLQLRDALRAALVDRGRPADQPIPSERTPTRLTGLSRMTVRQAVGELTTAGLLRSQHGRGAFLVSPPVEQEVQGVYSFTDRVARQGRTPSSTLLARDVRPATGEEAEALAPGDPPGPAPPRRRRAGHRGHRPGPARPRARPDDGGPLRLALRVAGRRAGSSPGAVDGYP